MSNNISDKQLRMSLAGQIALKLDAKDGKDGKISQSIWNEYWEENNAEEFKGKKENVGQNGVSIQEAFKLIMTRIFNAAKNQLNGTEGKSWDNQTDKENAINTVAKEWLIDKADGGQQREIVADRTDIQSQEDVQELGKNQTPPIIEQPKIQFTKEQYETKIANIKQKLNDTLKGRVFKGPNGITVSGERLLDILNKEGSIYYAATNYGPAQAHSEKGQIEINTNALYLTDSDAELMKIIIHEALHVAYNTRSNTWDEERCCESQALQVTADIVKGEKEKQGSTFTSFNVYTHNIEDFADETLVDSVMSTWLAAGYSNRSENAGGDIAIIKDTALITPAKVYSGDTEYLKPENRIEIKQGDEVFIDGVKLTTIGEAKLESINLTNNGNSNICILYTTNKPPFGTIVFDDTIDRTGAQVPTSEPKNIEIRQPNGNIIKGKIYGYSE